jgi:hypothetical protein
MDKPKLSNVQKICVDALNNAVNAGDVSKDEAEPMIAKCSTETLAPKQ